MFIFHWFFMGIFPCITFNLKIFYFHSILVDFEVHQFHFSSIAFLNFKLRGNISKWYFKVMKVWEFKGFSRGFIAMCWMEFARFNLHGKNLCVREFVKVSDFLIRTNSVIYQGNFTSLVLGIFAWLLFFIILYSAINSFFVCEFLC